MIEQFLELLSDILERVCSQTSSLELCLDGFRNKEHLRDKARIPDEEHGIIALPCNDAFHFLKFGSLHRVRNDDYVSIQFLNLADSTQASLQLFHSIDGGDDDPVSPLDCLFHNRLINPRFPVKDDSNIIRDFW